MRYRVLYDRLIVNVLEPEERTASGLYIPPIATDGTPWCRAEVLFTGEGRLMANGTIVPCKAKPGDVIMFFRTSIPGEQLWIPALDGSRRANGAAAEWLVIRDANILMVLEDLESVSSLVDGTGRHLSLSKEAEPS